MQTRSRPSRDCASEVRPEPQWAYAEWQTGAGGPQLTRFLCDRHAAAVLECKFGGPVPLAPARAHQDRPDGLFDA